MGPPKGCWSINKWKRIAVGFDAEPVEPFEYYRETITGSDGVKRAGPVNGIRAAEDWDVWRWRNPQSFRFYKIQRGDNLLTVAGKAYGLSAGTKRLHAAQFINCHPFNRRFWDSSLAHSSWWPHGRILFNPRFDRDVAKQARTKVSYPSGKSPSGDAYAMIWIPNDEYSFFDDPEFDLLDEDVDFELERSAYPGISCVTSGNPYVLHCFPPFTTELTKEHHKHLDVIAKKIRQSFSTPQPITKVMIVGHSSAWYEESASDLKRRAYERASNAREQLILRLQRIGLARRVEVAPPVGRSATERWLGRRYSSTSGSQKAKNGRALNRRVEIRLIKSAVPGILPPPPSIERPPNSHPFLGTGQWIPTRLLGPMEEKIRSGELDKETAELLKWILEPGIIKKDDRRRIKNSSEAPYRWICLLVLIFPDPDDPNGSILFAPRGVGSGVLIGTRHVLTAAHNLFAEITGSEGTTARVNATAAIVIPGHRPLFDHPLFNPFPFGIYFCRTKGQAKWFTIPSSYRADPKTRADFGLIRLPKSIGNALFPVLKSEPFGWWGSSKLGHGTRLAPHDKATRQRFQRRTVRVCGYPGDKIGDFGGTQWISNGKLRDDLRQSRITTAQSEGNLLLLNELLGEAVLTHTADLIAGNSGGPIWINTESDTGRIQRRLVGVVSGAVPAQSYQDTAFNLGVWLTPEIFQEVKRWLFGL